MLSARDAGEAPLNLGDVRNQLFHTVSTTNISITIDKRDLLFDRVHIIIYIPDVYVLGATSRLVAA